MLSLLLSVGQETVPHGGKVDPNFQYGKTQAYVALAVLVICFVVTVLCAVLAQRFRHKMEEYRPHQEQEAGEQAQSSLTSRRRARGDEAERHLLDLTESEESDNVRSQANYRAVEHTGHEERK